MYSQSPPSRKSRLRIVNTALFVGACVALVAIAGCGGAGDDSPSTVEAAGAEKASSTEPETGTACGGMTPLEAARFYADRVRRAGASKRFLELVTEPTPEVESSPAYPKLVGAFYASTHPPPKRAAAAAACAEELAAK